MTVFEGIRVYSIVISCIVMIFGTMQAKRWVEFDPQHRLLWLAVAVLNFTVFIGSVESLRQSVPGGYRVYATALGVTWLLVAVLYRPVCSFAARRRKKKKERPS